MQQFRAAILVKVLQLTNFRILALMNLLIVNNGHKFFTSIPTLLKATSQNAPEKPILILNFSKHICIIAYNRAFFDLRLPFYVVLLVKFWCIATKTYVSSKSTMFICFYVRLHVTVSTSRECKLGMSQKLFPYLWIFIIYVHTSKLKCKFINYLHLENWG